MNERVWSLITLAVSLVLAGLSILLPDSLLYARALIGAAIVLVLAAGAWTAYEWFPRVITDSERPGEIARLIYRRAARYGGRIYATHIWPLDRNPESDFAVKELTKAGSDIQISFHRILLVDSILDERAWLDALFSKLKDNISKTFYTLHAYPQLLPRFVKALLPRLNLILYRSPQGSCHVLVGLDRVHLSGVTVNFALYSRSKRVHDALRRYFDKITGSGSFRPCTTLAEREALKPASSLVERGQAVVSRIVDCAETTPGIVFVGLFGSMARSALGLTTDVVSGSTDADVDLVILFDPRVYQGTEQGLQKLVEEALDPRQTRVTWGPHLSPFYPFRDQQRVDVDIECHQVGSNFYLDCPLLGYSIFRYFMPLYSVEHRPVLSYVDIPTTPLVSDARWSLVVSDRQGLQWFKDRLPGAGTETDPRRLCTHVLRNVVWAITGTWPTTGKSAGQYLAGLPEWKGSAAIHDAVRLLDVSTPVVRGDLEACVKKVIAAIDCCLSYVEGERNAT